MHAEADYREAAERFMRELRLEHYRHFAGLKDTYEVEAVFERHASLFSREAVESLREQGSGPLLELAVQGLIGRSTASEEAELAALEASLEAEVEGERIPFRRLAIEQANEPEPGRRAALHRARLELTSSELQPLLLSAHERTATLARELGYASVRDMCAALSGVDLMALRSETDDLLRATVADYQRIVEPQLRAHTGLGFDAIRASDLAAFFRAPSLDAGFPPDGLDRALERTAAGLGIDLAALENVTVDAESRPTKSPRAFCVPVRVPEEVYLVLAPIGGRDDYATLLHEAGHAFHFGHVDPGLPFEARYLGENAVTEGYAFLLQYLAEDAEWLRRCLGLEDPAPVVAHARAEKLIFLRRYCAKLAYEVELHGPDADLASMPRAYAGGLSDALHLDWPPETWLSDVDPFFYVASYLRAWAFDAHLRRHLRELHGPAWFDEPEAGELLRSLWSEGQGRTPEAILGETTGRTLDFSALAEDLLSEDLAAS